MSTTGPSDSASKPLRVLIADDSSTLRAVYTQLVESLGHEVVGTAEDGQQAINLCERERPDVAILDILMLHLGGVEAARAIRSSGTAKAIVFLTSQNNRFSENVAHDLRAYRLVKPVHHVEPLAKAIEEAVKLGEST